MIRDGIDQDLVVKTIVGWWDDWKLARKAKEDKWEELIANYLVYIDEKRFDQWPWRCKVADPFSQETADTIASSLRNNLFPVNEDYFEVIGDDDRGKAHAATMQDFMEQQLHRMRFIERLGPWTKQLTVIGNAPLLLGWKTQDVSRRFRTVVVDPATRERRTVTKDERQRRYDAPSVTGLDAFDVVFNPAVMTFEETPFIRRTLVPRDRLTHLYKDVDLSALEETAKAKPTEASDQTKVARARIFGIDVAEVIPGQHDDPETVEVLELHGDGVFDGERYDDHVMAVLNRKVLAKFERNPFWAGRPLVWGTYDDLWFTPFGKGPLEPVSGTQQLIDTFSCQKADILNLIINGCFAYVDDGVIDPETLILRPRGGIEVANIGNLKELHPNQNVALTYQEIEMLRARGERSTGSSRFDMGQAPGGRRTAYEASIIRAGGSGRAMDVTKHLANDVLEYVLEFFLISNQQMLWDQQVLDNEALLGRYHVNYIGADLTAMRQFFLQQGMMFLDMMGRYKPLADVANLPDLAEEIASYFHFRNKHVIKTRAQYQADLAKQQAQEQQAQQQQAQQGPTMSPSPVNGDMAAAMAGA
ncbi:MAG TPA: hypothetical protein VFS39_03830 [Nitrospira sp.]|nr:hypothetical protein [Nitrospira sp.]